MKNFVSSLPGIISFVKNGHRRLSDLVRPSGQSGGEKHDLNGRFAILLGLSGVFIPFFVMQFTFTGYPEAAGMMAFTGLLMLTSFWVYKTTGRLAVARDMFLGSLYGFLIWEAAYYDTVYSPGSLWFVVMPVVSVLLGSPRASACWLLAALAALALIFFMSGEGAGHPAYMTDQFRILYSVSLGSMIVAVVSFVLIVDAARAEAHKSLESANAANRDLAERDELTGLFNRRALLERINTRMQQQSRLEEIAILVADLDGFKDINDTYGHHVGDRVIQDVSSKLSALCEDGNTILARLGGDEFAIFMSGEGCVEKAHGFAQAALEITQTPIEIDGRATMLGISLGLGTAGASVDAAELMRRADVAMYEAKHQGKNRLCRYRDEIDGARAKRLDLAKELDQALSDRLIEVHYQPIVDSRTRGMTGVEALARWTAPSGEAVHPDEFISIAEESGIINRLGLYVLEKACRDAAAWPGLTLSVNLSPVQFRSPTLVGDILQVLNRTGFPAARLELEMTEGYLIEHRERALPVIEALRAEGIRIALDDFGSGYSSIGYLRQYRFDRLKIDRSLVNGMLRDEAATNILQAIALLAQSLTLDLTAEGVETDEQAQLLQLTGCSSLQGYPGPFRLRRSMRCWLQHAPAKAERPSGRQSGPEQPR
jgi:diguanylate cyclase (GGDEF)-like protein